MKTVTRIAAVLCLFGIAAPSARAQTYPDRPVRIVVPYGPGTVSDLMARLVAERLGAALGQPFVIENRAGGGGIIGADIVAKAAGDGYTLLSHSLSALDPAVIPDMPYDAGRDFAGIAPIAAVTGVLIGAKGKGFGTFDEMVALAKREPGRLNYASTGPGSPSHLIAETIRAAAGFEAAHIPYKGTNDALSDVVAGQVDFYALTLATALPLIQQGKVLPLAITSSKRPEFAGAIPTLSELGVPFEPFDSGVGLWAPKRTPREIVELLNRELIKAVESPSVRERLAAMGSAPWPLTPAEFDDFMARDIARVRATVARLGIRPN